MRLDTVIYSPRLVAGGSGAWTGTLAEAITLDGDRLEQRAADRGLPMRSDVDGEDEPDWQAYTLADWRDLLDDPNARVVGRGITDAEGGVEPLDPAHFRALRELAGLTQQDVAAQADVADRTARRWEATRTAPEDVTLWVLAEWQDVWDAAVELAESAQDGVLPAGSTDQERAITRLALVFLQQRGRDVRVVGP